MRKENNNCDNVKCIDPKSEVRVLRLNGDSNLILCQTCFNYEINYRIDRNKTLGDFAKFKIPAWNDLTVYMAR